MVKLPLTISTFCENSLSLVNELRLLNSTATSETYPAMLKTVLDKRGLGNILGHMEQG
jgi:hypothetical protein